MMPVENFTRGGQDVAASKQRGSFVYNTRRSSMHFGF